MAKDSGVTAPLAWSPCSELGLDKHEESGSLMAPAVCVLGVLPEREGSQRSPMLSSAVLPLQPLLRVAPLQSLGAAPGGWLLLSEQYLAYMVVVTAAPSGVIVTH